MTATETTQQTATDDPFESAMTAQTLPSDRTYFGEVAVVDVWHCVLEKGVGKRVFDKSRDPIDQRRTAIRLVVLPTKGEYEVAQDTIDTEVDWVKFTLPSLRKLSLDLRTLRGMFVQVKRVPTGKTYTNKNNEKKDRTALVFVATYPDRAACEAAANAFFAGKGKASESGAPDAGQLAPAADAAAPASNAERDFAAQALPVLWQASGQNPDEFHAKIAANPLIAKYFNAQSPEVCQLTGNTPF